MAAQGWNVIVMWPQCGPGYQQYVIPIIISLGHNALARLGLEMWPATSWENNYWCLGHGTGHSSAEPRLQPAATAEMLQPQWRSSSLHDSWLDVLSIKSFSYILFFFHKWYSNLFPCFCTPWHWHIWHIHYIDWSHFLIFQFEPCEEGSPLSQYSIFSFTWIFPEIPSLIHWHSLSSFFQYNI